MHSPLLNHFAPAPLAAGALGSALAPAPSAAHRIIRALRIAALAKAGAVDPQARLAELLGSEAAARAFTLLLIAMGQAWPDPLTVFRPCCPRLTHDEMTMLAMLHHAERGDRPAFDTLLADMIGMDARDCLYCASTRLTKQLAAGVN
jgi:hypothetical protein